MGEAPASLCVTGGGHLRPDPSTFQEMPRKAAQAEYCGRRYFPQQQYLASPPRILRNAVGASNLCFDSSHVQWPTAMTSSTCIHPPRVPVSKPRVPASPLGGSG